MSDGIVEVYDFDKVKTFFKDDRASTRALFKIKQIIPNTHYNALSIDGKTKKVLCFGRYATGEFDWKNQDHWTSLPPPSFTDVIEWMQENAYMGTWDVLD